MLGKIRAGQDIAQCTIRQLKRDQVEQLFHAACHIGERLVDRSIEQVHELRDMRRMIRKARHELKRGRPQEALKILELVLNEK